MNESVVSFEADLRIPLRSVIVALAAVGVVLLFFGNTPRAMVDRVIALLFAVAILVTASVVRYLEERRPGAARWIVVLALVAVISAGSVWLQAPEILALLAIPAALSAALISIPAALSVAAGETLLLLVLAGSVLPGTAGWGVVIPLLSVWCIAAVMVAVYQPLQDVAHWAWEYYVRAQGLLDEALERQVSLKQALDDLAQANLQLTRLNAVAQGLRQAAEDARAAKEQFVANVSHELRTPLNMIVGFSEMVVETPETYGQVPPPLLADLDVIHRNAEHLSELIDDVLDLSQIEAGEMALTREAVSLGELVQVAMTAVRPLFESKALYLEADISEDLPAVLCDRTRIREVLLNLLSNAGRFTDSGGVRVRAWQERGSIYVSVSDTGTGIATADLSKLFQPFQQVDGSIRRRYGGTGLGLNISKRFIELHGGRIWVESEEGSGTTFTFTLPLTLSVQDDYARWLTPEWEYVQRTRPSLAPKAVVRPRYVVLEPDGALERLLSRYLHESEIVTVGSLDEAASELSTAPTQALLVNNASVSGTLERLSASSVLPADTPVMVCSVPGLLQSSAELGVADRLVKPISRGALMASLERLGIRGGTVLIVDDEPDALQLFGRMLASSEYEYHALLARNGQEALRILEQTQPDVMLLDLVMPGMDGFQLLEARDREPALRDLPIIVVSARDPAGQPIVSSALAVTRGAGLSMHQLLAGIEAISRALWLPAPSPDPVPRGTPSG